MKKENHTRVYKGVIFSNRNGRLGRKKAPSIDANGINQFVKLTNWFFASKKAQKFPLNFSTYFKNLFKCLCLYYFCILLPLRGKISRTFIAFLNWRITSAINSKLGGGDPGHPSSPSPVVPSRTNRHFRFGEISD